MTVQDTPEQRAAYPFALHLVPDIGAAGQSFLDLDSSQSQSQTRLLEIVSETPSKRRWILGSSKERAPRPTTLLPRPHQSPIRLRSKARKFTGLLRGKHFQTPNTFEIDEPPRPPLPRQSSLPPYVAYQEPPPEKTHPEKTHPEKTPPIVPLPPAPREQGVAKEVNVTNPSNPPDPIIPEKSSPSSTSIRALDRVENWTRTVNTIEEFENQKGMHGPYSSHAPSALNADSVSTDDTILKALGKKHEKKHQRVPVPPFHPPSLTPTAMGAPSKVTSKVTSKLSSPDDREKTDRHKGKHKKDKRSPKEEEGWKKRHHGRSRGVSTDTGLNEVASPPKARGPSVIVSEHYPDQATARAAALARLEAPRPLQANKPPPVSDPSRHRTFDTEITQSTASFGHILHANGQPIPINVNTHPALLPKSPVPPGAEAPRGMHLRQGSGPGNGTVLGNISEQPEPLSTAASPVKPTFEHRSTVETVTDPEEPQSPKTPLRPDSFSWLNPQYMPQMESGSTNKRAKTASTALPDGLRHASVPPSSRIRAAQEPRGLNRTYYEEDPVPVPSLHGIPLSLAPDDALPVRPESVSTIRAESFTPPSSAVSTISATTDATIGTSMVGHLVQASSFHDETLCQLLDAARLNLIGEEAKRALMRAARARVIELKDERARAQEGGRLTPTKPLFIKKRSKRKVSGKKKRIQQRPESPSESGSESDTTPTPAVQKKSKVEELLESLLAGQDIDMLMREPVPDPEISADEAEIDRLGEELYRGRLNGLPNYQRESSPQPIASSYIPPPPRVPGLGQPLGDPSGQPSWHFEAHSVPEGLFNPPLGFPQGPPPTFAPLPNPFGLAPSGPPLSRSGARYRTSSGMSRLTPTLHHSPLFKEGSIHTIPTTFTPATAAVAINVHDEDAREGPDDWVWGPELKMSSRGRNTVQSDRNERDWTYQPLNLDRDLPALPDPSNTGSPSVRGGTMLPSATLSSSRAPTARSKPWDLIAQKICSWALLWDEDSFVKALEETSIGEDVGELAISVISMTMFRRIVQLRMTNDPPQVCDKLFVPPQIAEAINRAIHARQFNDAQALLTSLWQGFDMREPPRVIISLVKHGRMKNTWTANRYDLVTHRLTTYIVSKDPPTNATVDGRPYYWWHAIRQAWPGYNIPDPVELAHTVKSNIVPDNQTSDISLRATSLARNLVLGIRPEHGHNFPKLREQTWTEVNRLLIKKRAGRLHIDRP